MGSGSVRLSLAEYMAEAIYIRAATGFNFNDKVNNYEKVLSTVEGQLLHKLFR